MYFAKPARDDSSTAVSSSNGSSTTIEVEIEIMKGNVPFGEWYRQRISLQPLSAKSKGFSANITTTIHNSTDDKNEVSVQTRLGEEQKTNKVNLELPTDSVLITKVSVENELELCGTYIKRNSRLITIYQMKNENIVLDYTFELVTLYRIVFICRRKDKSKQACPRMSRTSF